MPTSAFAAIPGGWFTMGTDRGQEDERPPHPVFVESFELAVFPVTRAEYERFVNATGHDVPKDWGYRPFAQSDLPVVGVNWFDAVDYCVWRSGEEGRPLRLPTEAEWELAARGRQTALFPWGDVMPEWIPNGGRGPLPGPWPVTLGEPTDFGLFQLTTPRTVTRGKVISAKETSTLTPFENSSPVLIDIPPELISILVALTRRPSPTIETSVITGIRTYRRNSCRTSSRVARTNLSIAARSSGSWNMALMPYLE